MSFGRCCICTLSFNIKDVSTLKCGHTFHNDCIKRWINSSKTCPNCRERNTERSIVKLFFDDPDVSQSQSFLQADDVDSLKDELNEQKNSANELRRKLEDEKSHREAKEKELKSERKKCGKLEDQLNTKTKLINYFEGQIRDQDLLASQLAEANRKYKACKFYEYLRKSGGDENEINRYLTDDGDINSAKFISLLRRQVHETKKTNGILNDQIGVHKSERTRQETRIAEIERENQKFQERIKELEKYEKNRPLAFHTTSEGLHSVRKHSFGLSFEPTNLLLESSQKQSDDLDLDNESFYTAESRETSLGDYHYDNPEIPCTSKAAKRSAVVSQDNKLKRRIDNKSHIDKCMEKEIEEFANRSPQRKGKREDSDEIIVLNSPEIPITYEDRSKTINKGIQPVSSLKSKKKFTAKNITNRPFY